MNKDLVDSVIEANRPLFDVLSQTLVRQRVFDVMRREMKSAAELTEEEAQLELGFNTEDFKMPAMIAVPVDSENPLTGDYEWVPIMQATIADLDAHLRMLDVQIEADQKKRRHISLLRQSLVALIGEDSTLTVGHAAALAREKNGSQARRAAGTRRRKGSRRSTLDSTPEPATGQRNTTSV